MDNRTQKIRPNSMDQVPRNVTLRIFVTMLVLIVWTTGYAFGQDHFYGRLSSAALELTKLRVEYDPTYFVIDYPNGDVPVGKGVCTDVIIRAYRLVGVDLQKEVHEDMKSNFSLYPKRWGLKRLDKNIDHRRVLNLMVYFTGHGMVKSVAQNSVDFLPGDIVCWRLHNGLTHIGMVVNRKSGDGKRNLIVHNIGFGQELSDCLFEFTIIGHYRFEKQHP